MRDSGYAWKTEKTYIHWIRRFILFHRKQHPASMSARHVEEFLSNLANERSCSPSSQRIALNALVYLFRKFLCVELEALAFEKARIKPRLPVVLTHAEAMLVIGHMRGIHQTMASLLYGSGLRLSELLSLRVKDIDFEMSTITVRSGKGDKDRTTLLPQQLKPHLMEQISLVDKLHRRDFEDGFGEVYLPYALARKYPSAAKSWVGSLCSRHPPSLSTPAPAYFGAITSMDPVCARQSHWPGERLASLNTSSATRSATASRRDCCNRVTTFARSRSCSATRMSPRRKSIPMYSAVARWA